MREEEWVLDLSPLLCGWSGRALHVRSMHDVLVSGCLSTDDESLNKYIFYGSFSPPLLVPPSSILLSNMLSCGLLLQAFRAHSHDMRRLTDSVVQSSNQPEQWRPRMSLPRVCILEQILLHSTHTAIAHRQIGRRTRG